MVNAGALWADRPAAVFVQDGRNGLRQYRDEQCTMTEAFARAVFPPPTDYGQIPSHIKTPPRINREASTAVMALLAHSRRDKLGAR